MELALVLVVIGLVAGGVLAGKSLIRQAEIRKQMNQFREYEVAYMSFRGKYNCIPGDCATTTNFFSGASNGNGDGMLENNVSTNYDAASANWSTSVEYQSFFISLSQAGLVSGRYVSTAVTPIVGKNMPGLALNAKASFIPGGAENFDVSVSPPGRNPLTTSYRHGTNWFWAVGCNITSSTLQNYDDNCGVFVADDLRQIDEKLDDGMPLSGRVIGFGGYNSNNNCLQGTTRYRVSISSAQCQAAYQIE